LRAVGKRTADADSIKKNKYPPSRTLGKKSKGHEGLENRGYSGIRGKVKRNPMSSLEKGEELSIPSESRANCRLKMPCNSNMGTTN